MCKVNLSNVLCLCPSPFGSIIRRYVIHLFQMASLFINPQIQSKWKGHITVLFLCVGVKIAFKYGLLVALLVSYWYQCLKFCSICLVNILLSFSAELGKLLLDSLLVEMPLLVLYCFYKSFLISARFYI